MHLGLVPGQQVPQRTMDASLEFLLLDHPNRSHHPRHDSLISINATVKKARRKRKQRGTMDSTKRRDLLQGTRRPLIGHVEKRVRALRRLVPNGESMELHGLFMEVADYIACLQARIKAMQIMVKVLSDGSSCK